MEGNKDCLHLDFLFFLFFFLVFGAVNIMKNHYKSFNIIYSEKVGIFSIKK